MTSMRYDGAAHTLTVTRGNGTQLGSYTAYNNVDSTATLTHVPNGQFNFQDTTGSHLHPNEPGADTEDGSFGPHGILRFNVPGHPGIGVHSGQAHNAHHPGPPHATFGCIRTTNDAMGDITSAIASDPLTSIDVVNNDPVVAAQGHRQHRHGHAHAHPGH